MKKIMHLLTTKKIILVISGAVSFLICLILFLNNGSLIENQMSQQMASRWSDKKDVAQVSCFFSYKAEVSTDLIEQFRHSVDAALIEASIQQESPNGSARLWVDAYSADGKIALKYGKTTLEADAIGVGGDFFLFHPLKLISGSYFSERDLNQDYCIIDEDAAWQLFGSNDVAGMLVDIQNVPHIIKGVVRRESGRIEEAAGLKSTVIYVSYNTLSTLGKSSGINHYEILMPNPVKNFAFNYTKDNIGVNEKEINIIENSKRYNLLERLKIFTQFGTRSMNEKAIIYPYWENTARGYEDILALTTVLSLLFLFYPIILILIQIIIWWKHKKWTVKSVYAYLQDKAERKADKIREKHRIKKESRPQKEKVVKEKKKKEVVVKEDENKQKKPKSIKQSIKQSIKEEEKKQRKEEKEAKKELKKREKEEQDKSENSKLILGIIIGGIVILLLVFSVFIFNKNGSKGKENNLLAKQNVYSFVEIPFDIEANDYSIRAMTYKNDRLIVALDIYTYDEEEGTSENRMEIFTCNADGSDLENIELQKDSEKVSTYNYINQMLISEDGSVLALEEGYNEDYTDPENPIYENWMDLKCWNTDGTIRWSKNLDELKTNPEDYIYIGNMFVDDEGNIYLLRNDNETKFVTLDSNGALLKDITLDETVMANLSNMYITKDKTLLFLSYNDDWTKLYAITYDPKTDVYSEKQELPVNLNMYNINAGTTSDFILFNNNGVYSYNLGDAEVTPIMNIINSDLAASDFSYVTMVDDDHFVGAYRAMPEYVTKLAFFTKVNPEDIPDKDVLVLGVNYLDNEVAKRVVDFNKESKKYRITIRDYSEYQTMDDYMASYTQMNNEIMSGSMPDMLAVNSRIPVSDYIRRGLIEDIGKLIEQDEELSQIEFMENVFKAYSVDDKLYYVIPSFNVGTAVIKKTMFGDSKGWTMDDMLGVANGLPEGSRLFDQETTKTQFMSYIISYCGSDFIDVTTGKCKFDSEEFIKILEFAQTLPTEVDDSIYDDGNFWKNYESQYREGRTVVMPTGIYSLSDMNYSLNGYFGGDFSFVGFPNENSNGSVINVYDSYVISSRSPNKEGAWEFLRYYLTDECQESLRWGLPISKEYFLVKAQEATQLPYYLDQDGNKVEYQDSFYMNGESIELPPMTQEQVDSIVSFIESVDRPYYNNEEVTKIIFEEIEAYFSGQKDVKEIAGNIQNRVQLYVNEGR